MKKLAFINLLAITAIVMGCDQNQVNQETDLESTQMEAHELKVGYLDMVSSLTHFVAVENGYYEEQGLTVTGSPMKSSNLIAQDLAAGHIDAGIELSLIPVLKTLESSPNTLTIFSTSTITTENGFDAIIVKQNSPVQSLEELSGLRIAGFPGTTAKNSFISVFTQMFPNIEPPEFVKMAPNLHIQSLENGDVDALFAYEPVLSTGVTKFNYRVISPSIYGLQFPSNPIGVGALNTQWMETNPDLSAKFLMAIDKAVDFIEKNPEKAKRILAKATKIDESIAQNMNTLPLSKSSEINRDHLQAYMKILLELNEIEFLPEASEICIPRTE